jgi:hypothetical protein
MPRKFPFLRFKAGVNWKDVNPALLARLNNLGAALGKLVTVTSGFRTRAEQAALYERYKRGGNIAAPPGQSNHESGNAVDATIDGVAVGKAVGRKTLKKYGLASPVDGDPVHVELTGKPTAKSKVPQAPQPVEAQVQAQPMTQIPQLVPAGGPPAPEETVPGVTPPPGSQGSGGFEPRDLWRQIASAPDADPETLIWLQRAETAGGNGQTT